MKKASDALGNAALKGDKMEPDDLYVICLHKSGRAFALNRRYQVKAAELPNYQHFLDTYPLLDQWTDGWLPSGREQIPDWVVGLSKDDFHAYFIAGPACIT